jgi:uncharacterized protein
MRKIFSIPIDSKNSIVYAPLHGVVLQTGSMANSLVDKIEGAANLTEQDFNSNIYKTFEKIGLTKPNSSLEKQVEINTPDLFEPAALTIIPTEGCNLGCTYCYASAMPIKDKILWEKIAIAADTVVVNVNKIGKKSIKITFYGGGEPTVHFDLIKKTFEYVQQKAPGIKVHGTLITNGTLLDLEKVKWLKANEVAISLSFDVLPDVQHFQRPYANGTNSHNKVMKAIAIMEEVGIKFGIRATVTENNLLSLVDTVEFVREHLPNVKRIHLEPSTVIGRSLQTGTQAPYDQIFVQEFKKAYDLGKKYGIKVRNSMSENMGKLRGRACMPEFTITSSDTISACHRYSRPETPNAKLFTYGSFNQEKQEWEIDNEKYKTILNANVHHFPGCKDCFARYNCAGDCLSTRVDRDTVEDSGQRCYMVREMLKMQLLEKIENSKMSALFDLA